LSLFVRHWAPWGDEAHYLETVRRFGEGLDLQLLRSYPHEMTGPLGFVAYGLWGRMVGFDLWPLRLLSPLLALATCLLLTGLLQHVAHRRLVIAGTAMLALNPYFVGLAVFVFTDMLALLFMLVAVTGFVRDRRWLTIAGMAGAVTTRQFQVFLVLAFILASFTLIARRPPQVARQLVAIAVGLLPFGALVWLWGGLSPANSIRRIFWTSPHFDLHGLSLYLAIPGVYALPLVIYRLYRLRHRVPWSTVAGGIAIAALVLIFPVRAAAVQVRGGWETVGFAHRALTYLLPGAAATAVWFASACCWLVAAIEQGRRAWRSRDHVASSLPVTACCGVISFLAVMPFSYMPWEKYALPLIVFAIVVLCMETERRDELVERSGSIVSV
jgi:4-amino-4-deoxy-L-arabinose transferase-like glycosyltransferase